MNAKKLLNDLQKASQLLDELDALIADNERLYAENFIKLISDRQIEIERMKIEKLN